MSKFKKENWVEQAIKSEDYEDQFAKLDSELTDLIKKLNINFPPSPPSADNPLLLNGERQYALAKGDERAADLTAALAGYREAADQYNFPKAFTAIGMFYLMGLGGVAEDKLQANRYFQQAANAGHSRAMYNLAEQLRFGDGIPKNKPESLFWYGKAEQAGYSGAKARAEELIASEAGVAMN